MPKWLRLYLRRSTLEAHLRRALWMGALARAFSAMFVYGPQALDDYKHGVYPAWQMAVGQTPDLPEYRSHLLNWVLSLAPRALAVVGIDSALAQVRGMYFELALISLIAIYAAYVFAKHERSRLFGRLCLYLTAIYPLMPFVATRAFGEAVAVPFVALGFAWLPTAPFAAFLALGFATLFRFHVGVLFFAAAAGLVVTRRWRALGLAFAAGVVTLVAEIAIDLLSGKAPLGTLSAYLAENAGGAARYGVSPWYNPWAFTLVVALAPFSFVFARKLRALARHLPRVWWPTLLFVFVHSLVAHKEERFLYPVLALELWLLGYLWASSAYSRPARRVFAPAAFVITSLGLVVTCFVNSQAGEIEPPARIEARYRDVTYLDHESLFGASLVQFYFLRPPSRLVSVAATEFTATRVDDELAADSAKRAVALLTSSEDARESLRAMAGVTTLRARCGDLRRSGSLIDRVLYGLNPRHNQRRRPTWYLVCERS